MQTEFDAIPDSDEELVDLEPALRLQTILASNEYQCPFDPVEDEDDPFARSRRNPAAEEARVVLSDKDLARFLGGLNLSEDYRKHRIYEHLAIMPRCVEVMRRRQGGSDKRNPQPLRDVIVITIHHLDDKACGAHAVLRQWGATDMTAVFVGYNQLMNEIYRPQLDSYSDERFRTCIITGKRGEGASMYAEKTYRLVRNFSKFPENERLDADEFDRSFKTGGDGGRRLTYLQAMRCLTVFIFLRTVSRGKETGKKLLVFEDGGYLHPIINKACLQRLTVGEFRAAHRVPSDRETDLALGPDTRLEDVLRGTFVGSTEWTRNGYNRNVSVQRDEGMGKLAFPVFTNAVSRLKTNVEGDTIAVACLTAITTVLYSLGVSVKERKVVLMGARGNIGRFFARHIAGILEDPTNQLLCCDLKLGECPASASEVPAWADAPEKPIAVCRKDKADKCSPVTVKEAAAYKEFDTEDLNNVDLIVGLTGGPQQVGKPTVMGDDLERWLLNGYPHSIYLASGSTKTAEFSDVLRWLDDLLSMQRDGANIEIRGRRVISIEPEPIKDRLAEAALRETVGVVNDTVTASNRTVDISEFVRKFRRSFGTLFNFKIEGETPDALLINKRIGLLYNTYPINFMFYGTPAEVLDWSYAQLLDITAMLALRADELGRAEVYATDYKNEATEGVFGATDLARDYPVPDPAGMPLKCAQPSEER